ncbi:MAG: ABC transporter ATP-binding protein [Gammaproteobacteria bacterium]|mgnify:FL=1|jgi:multiple sugar transport system ATP-binding protein
MARVTLDNVNKIYVSRRGNVHAVQDMSLVIEDGEFISLLGPSGCGKSSTLRMIVGLESVTSGEIRFDGELVNELEPQERNVAMAFETYALYPNFTIEENLGFPLEVRGISKQDRKEEVHRIAELLQIEDVLGQKPGALSGGQQQRVSLGRALIRAPAVFILDEVMSHLDAHLKFQMMIELRRIHQSLERTMLFVTHDQMEALALSDRVAVMSDGRLHQFGTRDDLYHAPANVFVAGFIGEPPTNFFTARPDESNGELTLLTLDGGARFHLSAERASRIRAHGANQYVIGIRPQNMSRIANGLKTSITAQVLLNEYSGEHSILTLTVGENRLQAITASSDGIKRDESAELYYHPDNVLVFDVETENLLT